MNVRTQTSTSTKNSTVNAVGNLNRRLGSSVVSSVFSGLACVSAVMMPARLEGDRCVAAWGAISASGPWLIGLSPASLRPLAEDRETLTPIAFRVLPRQHHPFMGDSREVACVSRGTVAARKDQ
jgi:hypothetical protein